MTQEKKTNRRTLSVVLCLIFAVALVMGAGPGIYLVNPDPSDPSAKLTIFGNVPVIYAWVVLWYMVEAAMAVIAFFYIWDDK